VSFGSVADFMAMGGHGFYVWLCYSATLLMVLGNVLVVRSQRRRTLRQLAGQKLRQGIRELK